MDVNTKIGGRDIDYEPQPARAAADQPALMRAYRSGAVDQGTNLDQVAIIDLRGPDPGAFHDVYRTYALRARLEREHGTAANQLLWRGSVPLFGDPDFESEAIVAMDKWLAAIEADSRNVPLAQKILEDRPADVTDRCTDGAGTDMPSSYCDAVVQSYSTARIEAGMPFTDDVIKCNLKPLQRSSYFPILFSDAQWAQLQAAFPTGVCDYSQWGVDREPTVPWLTYESGPGGEPLGPTPVSTSFGRLLSDALLQAGRDLLDRRAVAVRIAEEHETPPREVLDFARLDATVDELRVRGLDIGDHQLEAGTRTGGVSSKH